MMTILGLISAILLGVLRFAVADVDFNLDSFENVQVGQTVDIVNPYLEQHVNLQVKNIGSEEASSYILVVPEEHAAFLAKIKAQDLRGNDLEVSKISGHTIAGFDLYSVAFEYPVSAGSLSQLKVVLTFSRGTYPHPAVAEQSETQWLLYEGTKNYVSLYKTRSQETQFTLVTDKFDLIGEDEGRENPSVDPTGYLKFGPFEDVASLEKYPLALRFENPLPLSFVESLKRSVWVSHWGGSVSFDESYDVHNVGTKISSRFSRLEFSKPKIGFSLNNAAIRGLRIQLPQSHREEYYVDLVGNVSTSAVTPDFLEIIPRYPIMGGWFYNFTVGWASNLGDFVKGTTFSQYILSVPLVGGPEKTSYGKVSTKVILPEGASHVEIFSSVPYDELKESLTYSYLDLYGRPTAELEYSNLVSEHSEDHIYVTYYYSPLAALRKPLSYTVAVTLGLFAIKFAMKLL